MEQITQIKPRFLTVRETAETLRLGLSTTYLAIQRGDIRAIRIGGAVRVPDTEIDRLHQGEAAA
jgi:excisionase family DNA binding protein